jgi:hypothetical protein
MVYNVLSLNRKKVISHSAPRAFNGPGHSENNFQALSRQDANPSHARKFSRSVLRSKDQPAPSWLAKRLSGLKTKAMFT